MHKFFAALIILTLHTSPTIAQSVSDDTKALTDRVTTLLNENLGALNSGEQRLVRLRMREIEMIFAENGIIISQTPAISQRLVCDSMRSALIDVGAGGVELYRFRSLNNCDEARDLIKDGQHFCDWHDNSLRTPNGRLVHSFESTDHCRLAAPRVSRGMDFCDYSDNTLRNPDTSLIFDFNSRNDCRAALSR